MTNVQTSVPAIFVFRLVDAKLSHTHTLRLTANALDLTVIPTRDNAPARVVIAVDGADADNPQLAVYQLRNNTWEPSSELKYQATEVSGLEASRIALDKMLYTVENLRKTDQPYGEDGGDGAAPDSEAPSTPAE